MGELQVSEYSECETLFSYDGSSDGDEYLDLLEPEDVVSTTSLSPWEIEKVKTIEGLLGKSPDIDSLRELCYSRGGLLKDDFRKQIWPELVKCSKQTSVTEENQLVEKIQKHTYYNQVVLDVKRILKRFPPGIDEVIQADLQVKVTHLIVQVLLENSDLHYYQGFHDIAITLLLVLGEQTSFRTLHCLAQSHFQLYMGPNMEPTMEILNLVYILVKKENPALYDYLMRAELGTIFCLPWTITWFGHVLNTYETVVRLFDLFISTHPWTSIYLSAVIVLHRSNEIFATPCEMPFIHKMLSDVPEDLPFDSLIEETRELMEIYPPDSIENEVKKMHQENLQRVRREEEEMRERVKLRKERSKNSKVMIRDTYWTRVKRPFGSPSLYVALSISVATVAFMYNFIRPSLEGF